MTKMEIYRYVGSNGVIDVDVDDVDKWVEQDAPRRNGRQGKSQVLNEKNNHSPWSVGAKTLASINHHHEYFDDDFFMPGPLQLAFWILEQCVKRYAFRANELLERRDGRRRRYRYRRRVGEGLLDEIRL